MGFQDRQYSQDDDNQFSFSGQTQSLCTTLVIINVVIFLVDWVLQLNLGQAEVTEVLTNATGERTVNMTGGWFAVHSDTLLKPWMWFQFLTYGFMHATSGPSAGWHLFGNMFVLWMFGRNLEEKYGRAEFLRIYLISIVAGGVVWSAMALAFGGSEGRHLIGASGAVTTILMLFIFNFPKETIYLGFLIPVPAWVLGVIIVGMELMGAAQAEGNVAHSVHLVGVAFGVAYFYLGVNFGRFFPDRIALPKFRFKRKPKLKIHSPTDSDPYGESDEEAEHLLDKVRDQGIDALSPAERRKLEAYSRRMRQKLS
ncbi:MAG: rhomboid family intramembrane serine protease [Pirellulaceae bacterium]